MPPESRLCRRRVRNLAISLIFTSAVLLSFDPASAQDAAAPMRRSLPTPTPEPTATEAPAPKEELPDSTPMVEIPATETKKTPARPAPSKNTTRAKPVTEVESRRSALAVEPVHAVEPRDSSARQPPTPPPEKPRLFQPA